MIDPTFLANTLWNFFTEEYQKLRTETPEADLPDLVKEALVPSAIATQEFLRAVQALQRDFEAEKEEAYVTKS